MKRFLFLSLLVLLVSCGKTQQTQEDITQEIQDTINVSKSDISKINYTDFILDSKSKEAVANWDSYNELTTMVSDIKQGDLSYFKDNSEIIDAFIKDFRASIPESINTASILARVTVVETKLYKLESAVNLNTTTKDNLLLSIKEFLQTTSNLHLQINKKFEKEGQRIEKP